MTGKVSQILRGMVCLDLEDGHRCWFEPLGSYKLELGDLISGNLWSLGGEELLNVTRNCKMTAFIQDHTPGK